MVCYYSDIEIKTKGEVDIVDITDEIQRTIEKSKIRNGIVCVFVNGSTGAVTTIEYEPGLKKDFPRIMEKLVPKEDHYAHHETWHDDNGHSHIRASLIGSSICIPVKDGNLIHGTWQQVVFIELDTRPRQRKIAIQIVGD